MRRLALAACLTLAAASALAGCAHALAPTATAGAAHALAAQGARATRGLTAEVLLPAAVPAETLKAVLGPTQAACDESSRRRQIDFFNVHANPVGLRLGSGADAGYLLSFLGTSKERATLNVEARAAYGAGQLATVLNYSGPTTLTARLAPERPKAPARLAAGRAPARDALSFELITGLPGNGVADAYDDFMTHLARQLEDRTGAAGFQWDDAPIIFAVHQGDAVTGFVFCDQGNRLVLGDRKYADVQSVAALDAEGEVLASYTLIGWNPKTGGPDKAPVYRVETDDRFGAIVEFGKR